MKFFTLFFVFLPTLLFASLSNPNYSVYSDAPSAIELSGEEPMCTDEDSVAQESKPILMPMTFASPDNCGQGIGYIELTPDPNTQGPWVFLWSNGETTQNITGLTPGAYNVTIIDANNVIQMAQAVVGELPFVGPTSITAVATGNTLCNGSGNGALDLTVTPNPAVFTYEWSNGSTDMDITDLDPGIYTVSVTFGVTCTSTASFVVPNLTNFPVIAPPIGPGLEYCGTSDGLVGAVVVNGAPPYTYEWSNGGTDLFIDGLSVGTYTVTVTGANGCTNVAEYDVVPVTINVVVNEVAIFPNTTCNGANGGVTISTSPVGIWQSSATYEWSNGATTQNLTNVPTGSYIVTVTAAGTCTDTQVFFVEDEPVLPNLSFTNTAASCGLSNGAINLTPIGGVAPYSYLWSYQGATTQDLANIPAGNYEVTITSANMCTAVGNVEVEDNQAVFSYNAVINDNTSCDTINGSINLTFFPNNLTYTWSNGATTKNLTGLPIGDYTVTISAGGTCTAVETYSVGSVAEFPVLPSLTDTSTCGLANGGVDLSVTAGISPFTYLWSNGATTQDLVNIQADTFYVTVTSAVGCATEKMIVVPNVNDTIVVMGVALDNISCTSPTGNIALNVTPIDTAYTYLWSNGATTDSLSNLPGGTYLVTVTLGGECFALDTFVLLDDALPPNLTASLIPANCGFDNGSADITVNNGSGPFTFLWSNAATVEDLANLTPGMYTVTVTGANDCSAVETINILNNPTNLGVSAVPLENTSCTAANGSIDLSITPANNIYQYQWSNMAATEDLTGLSAGTYTVTVTFGTCLGTNSFTIVDNTPLPNLAAAPVAATCDFSNGSLDLSVNGGVGPFTYLWSNAEVTEDLTTLPPATYTVTVTGNNGCTQTLTSTVLNNNVVFNITGVIGENTSCTGPNGSIDVSVSPANAYDYLWSNSDVTEDLTNLSAGTYILWVNLGSCQSSSPFVVTNNTADPVLTTAIQASICGADNGAIDLTVSGPAGPYTYIWSDMSTDEDLSALFPGTYTVTVTASNGCTEVSNLNVPNNASNFSLAGTAVALTNCASDNGAIDLNITPAGAYTYLWSNGMTDEDLSNLPPGTYTVSVSESNNCTATASFFVIDQRTNPTTSQSLVPELCGLSDGSIDLGVNGGTAPYTYQWSNGQMTQDLINIPAGMYTVVVTDANNCTATAAATIPGNSINFSVMGNANPNTSCLLNDGAVDLTVNPAGAYTFMWSNGVATEDLANVSAGNYTVTVSAGGNCSSTANFTIANNNPTPALAQSNTPAFCGQANGSLDLTVSVSPGPHTYVWSNGAMVEDLNAVLSGTYTVVVTAANGCTASQTYTIPENTITPTIGSNLTQSTSCVLNNGAIDLTITPQGSYTYVWSNGSMTEDIANLAAATYTVTVSAGGACTNTIALTVTSNTPSPVLTPTLMAAFCGQADGSIDLSVAGSPAPYTYLWSNGDLTEDLSNVPSGTYSVTVTANNGCTTIENFDVPEDTVVPALQGTPTAMNSCVSDNGAIDLNVTPVLNYTFTWSNGLNTEDINNLSAGSYTVTVNAGGACTNSATFQVNDVTAQPQAAVTSTTTTLDCSVTEITLNGQASGTSNPITTEWLSNGTSLGMAADLPVSSAGVYDFVVVDATTGCTASASISISQNLNPPALAIANPALLTCTTPAQTLTGSSVVGGVQFAWATISGTDTTLLGNGPTLSVNTPGTYFLIGVNPANNCGNAISVNVTADQNPPTAVAGPAFMLDCAGETAPLLGSGSGAANLGFQWATQDGNFVSGANTASPMINQSGTYTLTVTNLTNGCTDTDAVTIIPEVPMVFATALHPNCQEDEGAIQIDSITGLSEPILYSLDNGPLSALNNFANVAPGLHILLVSGGNGCEATATVIVNAPDILVITMDATAEIALGYSYLLDAQINVDTADIASVTWTPALNLECSSCLSTLATPTTSTEYVVNVVSDAGCVAQERILIKVDRTLKVYGPNIFSPDDDGLNDVFTIYGDPISVRSVRSLRVFSRWGEEIFEQTNLTPGDESMGWNGTYKGSKLNPGVFVWQAVVEFADGQEEVFTGDVTLIR